MTLRARLTVAFLTVVLGPVLLGAMFVGGTVAAVSRDRSAQQLDLAASAVRTSIGALCQQLNAAAEVVAVRPMAEHSRAAADVVVRGLADAVRVVDATGETAALTARAPDLPWADCAGPGGGEVGAAGFLALAARIERQGPDGMPRGEVWAAAILDEGLIRRLDAASGVAVTLLGGAGDPASPAAVPVHSTDPTVWSSVEAVRALGTGAIGESGDGKYVRFLEPAEGQPLPLVLATPRTDPQGLYALLVAVVVMAGLLAVGVAWWLARSTTVPLAELAQAADQVADGDLTARVPVRAGDEAGRLAATFNRMTQQMQSYVQALTASRDQLRRHLGILGDTLSSTHDQGRILQVILQTALAATGARAGALLLLDPATGELKGRLAEAGAADLGGPGPATAAFAGEPPASEPSEGDAPAGEAPEGDAAGGGDHDQLQDQAQGQGQAQDQGQGQGQGQDRDDAHTDPEGDPDEDSDDPGTLRVPLGSGLLGSVAASGEARRGRVDTDGPALHAAEPRCRTYVAVPISAGGSPGATPGGWPAPSAVRGVLALYDRLGGDEFDDTDLVTLRTFAGQAAVAVDNVRTHKEAQRLSLTDPLTGLWNYRYLKESMRREVERASRFGRMLTVLALDLDRFKEVNDSYGHPAGDAVLAEFSRRVKAEIREVDLAFRQGGEEFVVLLPETDAHGGATVAQRLGAAVREAPVVVAPRAGGGELTLEVTVSIGIAVYPDHGLTPQAVLDAADDALYAAKAAGRDTYRVAQVSPEPVATAELPVRTGAHTPEDDLPRAGGGAQPPRQTRGR